MADLWYDITHMPSKPMLTNQNSSHLTLGSLTYCKVIEINKQGHNKFIEMAKLKYKIKWHKIRMLLKEIEGSFEEDTLTGRGVLVSLVIKEMIDSINNFFHIYLFILHPKQQLPLLPLFPVPFPNIPFTPPSSTPPLFLFKKGQDSHGY